MKKYTVLKALFLLVSGLQAGTDFSVTGDLRVWGKSQLTDTVKMLNLAGTGTRLVVVDATGKTSTQSIPAGGSLANPTGTIGLSVVNGSLTSAMRSDGAPALSQSIVPTWTGKHTFNDTVAGLLGFRAGNIAASNVNLYRLGANMWKTDDSLTVAGNLVVTPLAGAGTRMVVADANGVTSTQAIPSGGTLANPTGTIGLTAVNGAATSGIRSDGAPALSQAIVPTWSGKHTFNDTVAAEKGIRAGTVSASNVNLYRFGADMWKTDDSLTVAGNLVGLQLAGAGTRMVVADPNGVTSTQAIPSGSTLANPTGTIGLTAVNGVLTSGMRSDGAPALSQAIVPTWSGKHTFNDTVAAEKGIRAGTVSASNVNLYRSAANMWTTDDSLTVAGNIVGLQLAGTGTRMVVADPNGVTSTQSIPAGASLANPTGTIGLTAVNGALTSGMRSDGAPALSQAIVPTWSGKHTFNDTVAAELGIRSGTVSASNVNLYRSAANMWKTDDSLTVAGNLVGLQLAGTGTRMVVADANGVTSTQSIPAGGSLANPTGTIGLTAVNGSATSGMRSDGAPALSQAIVPTWSGKHTFNDTVAAELGIRAGTVSASNVNLYRVSANRWKTDDSLTVTDDLLVNSTSGNPENLTVRNSTGNARVAVQTPVNPYLQLKSTGHIDWIMGIPNNSAPAYELTLTTDSTFATNFARFGTLGGHIYSDFQNDQFTIDYANAGSSTSLIVKNTSSSANSDANLQVIAQNGNPSVQLQAGGKPTWSLIEDNTDSSKFEIKVGSTAVVAIDTLVSGPIQLLKPTKTDSAFTYKASFNPPSATPVTTGNDTLDVRKSSFFSVTMTGNITLVFKNAAAGAHFTIRLKQDATGGRTVTYPATCRFPSATQPTLVTTANTVNYLTFAYDEAATKWDFVGNALDLR